MIVLHEQRVIFLKTRKTAGTSIEIALSSLASPGDIVTPLIPEDEKARFRATGMMACNHDLPLHCYNSRDFARRLVKRTRPRLTSHSPAQRVKSVVGERVWQTYFKFAVERDPFDRLESLYWWDTRARFAQPTLNEFIHSLPEDRLSNYSIYSIDGVYCLDRLIQFENLQAELQQLTVDLGIKLPDLPRSKSGIRQSTTARESLDRRARTTISYVCRRELALFGYGARFPDTLEREGGR